MKPRSDMKSLVTLAFHGVIAPLTGLFYTGGKLAIASEGGVVDPPVTTKMGATNEIFNAGYAFEMLGALVLVVLCFFVVVVLVKRINGKPFGARNPIQLVSSVGVGPREKVILLQVGETQLLLGSTPNNIRTLHTFSEPVVTADLEQSVPSAFSSVLGSIGLQGKPASAASVLDKGDRP